MMLYRFALSVLVLVSFLATRSLEAQGTIRGSVLDDDTGEPIAFATVYIEHTSLGTNTDVDGFFNFSGLDAGSYSLVIQYLGYDSLQVSVDLAEGEIKNLSLVMKQSGIDLGVVDVSAKREQARTEVRISKLRVSPQTIRQLPSASGDADIAQYLTVIPGVVFTGDQGGKLYVRGGSPVQTKVLLDGMVVYNPFHSIGFFSVFDTDIMSNVDVLTGGFDARHGGRVSAVIDVKTREGNKKRLSGVVSASPFQAKILVEGPIKKHAGPGTGSSSFILSAKQSYLDESSKRIYSYIDEGGLPYRFRDLYGKLSFSSGNGSKLNVFGFNFEDDANFVGLSDFSWNAVGVGTNFKLIPVGSNFIVRGNVSISDYNSSFIPAEKEERTSGVNAFGVNIDFTYFGSDSEINYGLEVGGFGTDFQFINSANNTIRQRDNTTELGGYFMWRQVWGGLILEPSIRLQYYASLGDLSIEPRMGLKYNISDRLRFKMAGGLYSQNLISTLNDRDIINLFVGFLSGPDEGLFRPGTTERTAHRLQKSLHLVSGFELDLTDRFTLNVEPYMKDFTQLISLNRNKLKASDPNFQVETGLAYGIDVSLSKSVGKFNLWSTYSYARVERDDARQVYPTNFDRRHNVNFLASYRFGAQNSWETSLRWNFGSGFPFTQTQAFYGAQDFENGIDTDVLTNNPNLGIIFADERNGGRLPPYHRLDVSVKRHFSFGEYQKLTLTAGVTNLYDRENIFYFDRVRQTRVNQLPILPSLGLRFEW